MEEKAMFKQFIKDSDKLENDNIERYKKEENDLINYSPKQTQVDEGYEFIPASAMRKLATTMKFGAYKYGKHNHLTITCEDNLGRAVRHIYEYLDGDTSEDHLGHAISRLAMAIDSKYHQDLIHKKMNNNMDD